MATEEECKELARQLGQTFSNLAFDVWERADRAGEYYVAVISIDFKTPDLKPHLPLEWWVTDWVNQDQRAMTCMICRGEP